VYVIAFVMTVPEVPDPDPMKVSGFEKFAIVPA
jgi:hypothetical protein